MVLSVIGSGSKGNSYVLHDEKEALVLDCGFPFDSVLKACGYDFLKIKGALVSHEHSDHAAYASDFVKNGIYVYKPYEAGASLKKIGNFVVQPFQVPHDGTDCFGFYIEHKEIGKLLYLTDFEYCKYNFQKLKVNHILVEANYNKDYADKEKANWLHVLQGHCSMETSIDFVKANMTDSLKTLVFCHLSQFAISKVELMEEAKKIVPCGCEVAIASKGLNVELRKE